MRNLAGILCTLLAIASCQKREEPAHDRPGGPGKTAPSAPPQSAEEMKAPLAKIDDVTITIGEFEERINRQSPYIRARYTSLEQKKEFLDSLIRFEILAKEGFRRGYDKDPEVVRTMKQVMITKLMRVELDDKGQVHGIKVLAGLGHGLDQAAVWALPHKRECKFSPAYGTDGKPAAFVLTYTFNFEIPR